MIEVVLATFNGSKWIDQQIESILEQSLPIDRLSIRDDGSTDNTLEYIDRWLAECDRIRLLSNSGTHLGVMRNFSHLLLASCGDYVFLADQDDVWDRDKLAKLRQKMQHMELEYGVDSPLLVYSDSRVIDERNTLLSNSLWKFQGIRGNNGSQFQRVLMQNVSPGCAMLLNRSLIKLVTPIPDVVIMHDWWILLVASCLGHVGCLPEPLFNYRIHGENAVGAQPVTVLSSVRNLFLDYRLAIDRLRNSFDRILLQANVFYNRFEFMLTQEQKAFILKMLTMQQRNHLQRMVIALRLGLRKEGLLRTLGMYVGF